MHRLVGAGARVGAADVSTQAHVGDVDHAGIAGRPVDTTDHVGPGTGAPVRQNLHRVELCAWSDTQGAACAWAGADRSRDVGSMTVAVVIGRRILVIAAVDAPRDVQVRMRGDARVEYRNLDVDPHCGAGRPGGGGISVDAVQPGAEVRAKGMNCSVTYDARHTTVPRDVGRSAVRHPRGVARQRVPVRVPDDDPVIPPVLFRDVIRRRPLSERDDPGAGDDALLLVCSHGGGSRARHHQHRGGEQGSRCAGRHQQPAELSHHEDLRRHAHRRALRRTLGRLSQPVHRPNGRCRPRQNLSGIDSRSAVFASAGTRTTRRSTTWTLTV